MKSPHEREEAGPLVSSRSLRIPKTIHQVWIGDGLPPYYKRFRNSWRESHPEWDYILWTGWEGLDLRNERAIESAHLYTQKNSVGQFISDVMRYEILERFGGVYVDCDFECLKPLDELLTDVACFAAWEQQDVWIGNAILGAVPGAPFLQRLIEMLPWSIESNRGKRPNISTGPQFLTAQYREHQELTVFDQSMFYPASWREFQRSTEDFPDAVAVHHWSNQRRRAGVPLRIEVSDGSR